MCARDGTQDLERAEQVLCHGAILPFVFSLHMFPHETLDPLKPGRVLTLHLPLGQDEVFVCVGTHDLHSHSILFGVRYRSTNTYLRILNIFSLCLHFFVPVELYSVVLTKSRAVHACIRLDVPLCPGTALSSPP